MDMNKEREAFEKHFRQTRIYEHECRIRNSDVLHTFCIDFNSYINITTDEAWSIWQAAKDQPQWISVNDELPPIGETVLICWDDDPDVEPEKDFMDIDDDLNAFWANYYSDEPTHWMPITRPVKTQAKDHD